MTNALDEVRRLLHEATPGPWESQPGVPRRWLHGPGREGFAELFGRGIEENAALIVFLRNHAEDLLAVARASAKLFELGPTTPAGIASLHPTLQEIHAALSRLSPPSEEGS